MQITITCELNARNLDILKLLCEGAPVNFKIDPINKPHENLTKPVEEHPIENPFPEPQAKTKLVDEQPKITAQDVKAVCLKMSKAGRQSELKAAFAKFGGKKLSDIAEADYPALLKELGDA